MATYQVLVIALFVSSVAFHPCLVDATFYDSMYINWGAHHSSIIGNGDELHLVLDKTSGTNSWQFNSHFIDILVSVIVWYVYELIQFLGC